MTRSMVKIGERIRDLRKKRGLAQRDIERATGMLTAYISRVERGHVSPSLESIERFARALQVPLHELFRDGPESAEPGSEHHHASLGAFSQCIRNMKPADRELLVRLARRFAKTDE